MEQKTKTETEIWKPVDWIDGLPAEYYSISNLGRIRSNQRKCKVVNGYRTVPTRIIAARVQQTTISGGYTGTTFRYYPNSWVASTHRLVAIAFIPNPNGYTEVNHKDAMKHNNHYLNLEWCTPKQNIQHSIRMGRRNSDYCRKPVIKTDINTGIQTEYRTIYAATLVCDLSAPTIRHRCRDGKIKNNEKWQYK